MTREEKIKEILLVAEGKKSPGRADETIIWAEMVKGFFDTWINGREVRLNESQYKSYRDKIGGRHVILRFADVEDREPEQAPVMRPVIIPGPIVTEETEAEVTPTPAPVKDPVTITGRQSTYKSIPFEELTWTDSDLIGYMFPKRK